MNVPLIVTKISKSLWKQCKSYSSIKYSLGNSKFTSIENEYKAKVFHTFWIFANAVYVFEKGYSSDTVCQK